MKKDLKMKIDRLETHDRYEFFTKQSFDIDECVKNLIDQRPFGNHAFYIFAHARTDDDGVTKRLIWQPRLTKPKSQTNSMLFKVFPGTEIIHVIWMIPDRALWTQFKKGNVTDNKMVRESIFDFENNRSKLEEPDSTDLSDAQINQIYRQIGMAAQKRAMPMISEVSPYP